MILVSSALLSFLFVVVSSDAQCGHDEYYYAKTNKCIFYSTGPVLYYHDARIFCQQNGGDIVTVHSDDENNFIIGLMQQYKMTWAWIGLLINYPDKADNPLFSWYDGSPVNYTAFRNPPGIKVGDTQTVISKIFGYKWVSAEDLVSATPMCQRPYSPTAPTPSSSQCPIGALYSATSKKCFQLDPGPSDWLSAEGTCNLKNTSLASIHSAADNQLIAAEAQNRGYPVYWIGFNYFPDNTGNFTWSDDSAIDYTNWNPGVPATCNDGPQNVVSVSSAKGDWYNCLPHNIPLPFVCEVPSDGATSSKQAQKIPKHPKNLKI